jgi:hypothetical protein
VKIRETAPLDVIRDALALAVIQVEHLIGPEVDVPNELDDSAMDSAVFDLFCALRLARAAEGRARFLTVVVEDPVPKKPKKKAKAS